MNQYTFSVWMVSFQPWRHSQPIIKSQSSSHLLLGLIGIPSECLHTISYNQLYLDSLFVFFSLVSEAAFLRIWSVVTNFNLDNPISSLLGFECQVEEIFLTPTCSDSASTHETLKIIRGPPRLLRNTGEACVKVYCQSL